MKKIITVILIIAFLSGLIVLWLKNATSNMFVSSFNKPVHYANIIEKNFKEKTSLDILLMGYAGGTHDGTYLTDTMMLIHIDTASKAATLISLPRDLWVQLPTDGGKGYWKINAAYEIGLETTNYANSSDELRKQKESAHLAKYAVEAVTGYSVEKFIAADFEGFKKAVDLLGGVDVQVDKTFDDYEYPLVGKEKELCGKEIEFSKIEKYLNGKSDPVEKETFMKENPELATFFKNITDEPPLAFPCRYERLHFDAGVQHMSGEIALKFARSRHSLQDGTDFGRAARQRNLLIAGKQKALSIDIIPKIPSLIETFNANVKTDFSIDEIKTLISYVFELKAYTITGVTLSTNNILTEGFSSDKQYILTSREGIGDWESVHKWLRNILDPTPTPTIKLKP